MLALHPTPYYQYRASARKLKTQDRFVIDDSSYPNNNFKLALVCKDILLFIYEYLWRLYFNENVHQEANNSVEYCLKKQMWEKINESINEVVVAITLEDLIVDYRKMQGHMSLMFYI